MKSKVLSAVAAMLLTTATIAITAASAHADMAQTQIRSFASGYCLENVNGSPTTDSCGVRIAGQRWHIYGVGGQYAYIKSETTGECVTVHSSFGYGWTDLETCRFVASQYFTWKGSHTYYGGNMFWNPHFNMCLDSGQSSLVFPGQCGDGNAWQNWQLTVL